MSSKDMDPNVNHYLETTVKTALSPGKLRRLGRQMTEFSLDENLMCELAVKKIGTFKLECQAYNLHLESVKGKFKGGNEEGKKEKGNKLKLIRENRDPEKVLDLLRLKNKYCQDRKKETKKEYLKEKKRLREEHLKTGKERKFRKIISRISLQSKVRWEK